MNTHILFLHALSPLHPGTGQGVGSIDLPIARERSTGIPYLPGSSIKGVLRDAANGKLNKDKLLALFGPETGSASEFAGAAVFGDAKLLLFPVRSLAGVFAYVTSPYLLERFAREAGFAGLT
ncbi:type III-B CRISPR module RAMP protein Cmr4, partial [Mesomycoplasma ovipneumoniae]|uniref:type III-B CRISPR module RAMP protein Cmr4 n=1 Tax=Mesomycoplasma ovipneumoniae TaxID=29562 RepID=UPI0030810111